MKTVDCREMATSNEVEDLVTCGVCFREYDEVERKPKFLQCSHTVCLSCLKEIGKVNFNTCPFCDEFFVKFNVESLPNNPYAIHKLKLKKELPTPIEDVTNLLSVSWCLTCGSAEKLGCTSSGHSVVDMTADTIKSLEGLLKSKEELMKMKDIGTNQLTMAIEERQKVQEQLALILKSIQHSEEEIKKLQDENYSQMIQMVSLLERSGSTAGGAKDVPAKKELFFSELMAVVEGSTTEDTVDTLKQKMEQSIEMYEQKLSEASAIASDYEYRKKVKIAIHLFDENDGRIPTVPWLEDGFRFQPLSPALKGSRLKGSQIQQDSILVSHAVFSLLQRQNIQLKLQQGPAVSSPIPIAANVEKKKENKGALNLSATSSSLPPSISANPDNFILDQSSTFIVRLNQFGSLKGEIYIRPALTFEHPEFITKLGEFCFKSPKTLIIKKSSPRQYVLFSIKSSDHPGLRSTVPGMIGKFAGKTSEEKPTKSAGFGEFGIYLDIEHIFCISFDSGGSSKWNTSILGWNFLLPLEGFRNRPNQVANSKLDYVPFGQVISGHCSETVTQLARASKSERMAYTITLESR